MASIPSMLARAGPSRLAGFGTRALHASARADESRPPRTSFGLRAPRADPARDAALAGRDERPRDAPFRARRDDARREERPRPSFGLSRSSGERAPPRDDRPRPSFGLSRSAGSGRSPGDEPRSFGRDDRPRPSFGLSRSSGARDDGHPRPSFGMSRPAGEGQAGPWPAENGAPSRPPRPLRPARIISQLDAARAGAERPRRPRLEAPAAAPVAAPPAPTPAAAAASPDAGKQRWNPTKKLTYPAMAGIRELHAQDPRTFSREMLSEKFGVSYEAIGRILRAKNWRDKGTKELGKWDRRADGEAGPVPIIKQVFARAGAAKAAAGKGAKERDE
ncbi:hypothetical protein Q8F55_006555 [Vanrija albida]|uniref:Required for respiratory growth protein 9, mitochondrial n=1 Tax=Vanrija albida TaxID=181172 RepID=A0ABR3PXI6_9TREE